MIFEKCFSLRFAKMIMAFLIWYTVQNGLHGYIFSILIPPGKKWKKGKNKEKEGRKEEKKNKKKNKRGKSEKGEKERRYRKIMVNKGRIMEKVGKLIKKNRENDINPNLVGCKKLRIWLGWGP